MLSDHQLILALIQIGNLNTLEIFLKKKGITLGTLVNKSWTSNKVEGWTYLHHASQFNLDMVKYFIQNGIDINAKLSNLETPIFIAARMGQLEIVMHLCSMGAKINDCNKDDTNTPMIVAASKGHFEIVEYLLGKGASINTQNNSGETALIMAANHGRTEVLKILIKNNADTKLKDKNGRSAYDNSLINGYPKITDILKDHNDNIILKCQYCNRVFSFEKSPAYFFKLLISKLIDKNMINEIIAHNEDESFKKMIIDGACLDCWRERIEPKVIEALIDFLKKDGSPDEIVSRQGEYMTREEAEDLDDEEGKDDEDDY